MKAQYPNLSASYFLFGDSAYPDTNWLVTPFKDNGTVVVIPDISDDLQGRVAPFEVHYNTNRQQVFDELFNNMT
jgi:hypothetical protein